MSLHSDTLFWFRANQSLLFLLNAAFLEEKQQIPIVYSFVWQDHGSYPQSIVLEASTLTITLPMRFPIFIDWLARNQNNVSEWSDISTQWLLLAHLAKDNVSFYPLLFLLNAAFLAEKQHIPIVYSFVWQDRGSYPHRYDNVTLSPLLLPARVTNRSHSTYHSGRFFVLIPL
jgi:hypothetical protein